jgi:hypothetical protein
MGLNDFNAYFRNVTTNNLKVNKKAVLGNQAIYANQGNTYFVDSGATGAADTRSGTSWSTCLATLDGAINKCTANQGDVIFVAEGHTETYSTTGVKATFDTAGITVIGLGTGSDRPTFNFGHVDATWTISAGNITLVNLLFLTTIDSVVTFGTISGTDCTMINCESRDTTDKEVLDAWTVATTANRFKVDSYKHIGYIGGNANDSVFQLSGVDDFIIQNCIFMTQSGTTAGSAVIELATECLRGLIDNCVFYVDGKSDYSDNIVDTAGTSTVIVRNCYDLEAGGKFSGGGNGSSFSLAGDDVGTLSTSLATLQAEFSGATGIASFPAAAAPANNVSAVEVIRDIWEVLRNGTGGTEPGTNRSIINDVRDYGSGNVVTKDITYDGSVSYDAFTVTGEIAVKVIGVVTTALTNHGDGTSVGTATSAAGLIASTAGTAMQTIDQIWTDNAPSKFESYPSTYSLLNENIAVVGTANLAAGVVKLYAFWKPISSDGNLVAS